MVQVDQIKCDEVAAILAKVEIPTDVEDEGFGELSIREKSNFFLLAVGICHQTQFLEGMIAGKKLRGWDYLVNKLFSEAMKNREILNPKKWKKISVVRLKEVLFCPTLENTFSDLPGRVELVQNLGVVMEEKGWESFEDLYHQADYCINDNDPSLIGLLSMFSAYNDPVYKKSYFLLGLMANSGGWEYADEHNLGPPVDYHEVRGHLRLGTVKIYGEQLADKLSRGLFVTKAEDIEIRESVSKAIIYISNKLNLRSPLTLHYLFWNMFRNICLRESPYCKQFPSEGRLPKRYSHLLEIHGDLQCPFSFACESVDKENKYLEHSFDTDWY